MVFNWAQFEDEKRTKPESKGLLRKKYRIKCSSICYIGYVTGLLGWGWHYIVIIYPFEENNLSMVPASYPVDDLKILKFLLAISCIKKNVSL